MPELTPIAFSVLIRRMFYEFRREQKIFDLQARYFWRGTSDAKVNLGVRMHGMPAGNAVGPAAGPQTQMAQNIVLSWLGGCRIMELKTVQIDDRLNIPRPCIDATNVGYNIEFSQELLVQQSLEEYVKAWMLLRMLEEAEVLGVAKRTGSSASPHFYDCIFDLSCGYDLKGIQSEKVQAFITGLQDASQTIEQLRSEIPDEFKEFRSLDYSPKIVSSATLSTFHNCPPNEIEAISDYLLRHNHLHTIVKMNPTMLGGERLDELLHDVMGYEDITVNSTALTAGLQFDDSIAMMRRLRKTAHELGLKAGAKFSNTLEVLNHRDFFPEGERVMYMSGAPLHPIILELALKFRLAYQQYCVDLGAAVEPAEDGLVPISFSAGVDKHNFSNCVACGFTPVTTCTDLLKPGGYNRTFEYLKALEADMAAAGSATIEAFAGDPAASLANHQRIAAETVADSRYYQERNALIPKRINSHLVIFDCITCDKCIPVCPNDANFTYQTPEFQQSYTNYSISADGTLTAMASAELKLKKSRQIANFAAFCNECGNCDTFCPEYGGPFIEKPTFFPDLEQWQEWTKYDGFFIRKADDAEEIFGRIKGIDYLLQIPSANAHHVFNCPAGSVLVDPEKASVTEVLEARGPGGLVDMHTYLTLRILLQGVLHDTKLNYVNAPYAADGVGLFQGSSLSVQ